MFKTVVQAFKVPEIRKRLLFTIVMLIIVRIGCQLPLPGTDASVIKEVLGDRYNERNVVIRERNVESDNRHAPRLTLFGCNAGMNQYTISHDGQLLGCQMMGVFSTDARRIGFAQAWEDFPKTVKLPPVNEKCKSCEDIRYCNTCYASRYAETGDLGGCPEYVCKDVAMTKKLIETGGIT